MEKIEFNKIKIIENKENYEMKEEKIKKLTNEEHEKIYKKLKKDYLINESKIKKMLNEESGENPEIKKYEKKKENFKKYSNKAENNKILIKKLNDKLEYFIDENKDIKNKIQNLNSKHSDFKKGIVEVYCFMCKNKINKVSKIINCIKCSNKFHYLCVFVDFNEKKDYICLNCL
jgi:transketolase